VGEPRARKGSFLWHLQARTRSEIDKEDEVEQLGHPVRIISISFPNGRTLQEIAQVVDVEAVKGCDVVALPETWLGLSEHDPEPLDGTTITTMAALAKKHYTYIVCPIDRSDGNHRFNPSVLIDRAGRVVGVYDKLYPPWAELDADSPIEVGLEAHVFETEFGRVGLAICFDACLLGFWKRLADQGAELVVWSGAYSGGTTLQAHALMNHFYVVASTQKSDCTVYDIAGEEILYEKGTDLNVTHITLDLDKGIYHHDFNLEKRDTLLEEHSADVVQEKRFAREQWFVLKARRPGVSVRALAREYGMEELHGYIDRSRRRIDKIRGWAFVDGLRYRLHD